MAIQDGYRSGLESGEDGALQEGFEVGFKEAFGAAFEWGRLRAAIVYVPVLSLQSHCSALMILVKNRFRRLLVLRPFD